MFGRTNDPHRLDADCSRDELATLVGVIAQSERHLTAPDQIADLLTGRGPQIELDRDRALGELAQHPDDIGVRKSTHERQRYHPTGFADRRLYRLPPVLDRR